MQNTKIEWTSTYLEDGTVIPGHTFNPWWGCMKVSDGCKNCYAETLDNRYNHENPHWGPGSSRKFMSHAYWNQPTKWNREAEKAGVPAKVFCASMADVFEDHPAVIYERDRLFAMIDATPWLIWQLLTKRPENIMKMVPDSWRYAFPPNVWIGTSVENQKAADERIPHLLQVPAKVRFLSCEPLLGPVMLRDEFLWWDNGYSEASPYFKGGRGVHWVIAGGESGPHCRPMHPDWAQSLRDQCQAAQVPFLFKQWGEYSLIDEPWKQNNIKPLAKNERWLNLEGGHGFHGEQVWRVRKVGKHEAGRLLDGREWNEFPEIKKPQ